MAEEFIEELYDKAEIIFRIKQMIKQCRGGRAFLFKRNWESMQEPVAAFCRSVTELNSELGEGIWDELMQVRENISKGEYLFVADRLEMLIPYLYDAMSLFGEIDVTEGNYRLFSSRSGYLCVQNMKTEKFLNGSVDPAWENYEKACSVYHPWFQKFCTMGCGLGYLCWQMFEVSGESLDIYVYELNDVMVNYAMQFGVLGKIPKEQLHVIIESNPQKLFDRFSQNIQAYNEGRTCLNFESDLLDKMGKNLGRINEMQSIFSSSRNLFDMVERNYYRNRNSIKKMISELKCNHKGDEWIVVGGGSSVDGLLDYLRENIRTKVVIAATTVYQKLIKEGIKPDYIVAIDPQNRTYGHLKDCNDFSVPLLLTDAANWQFGEKYQGEKYLIPTSGFAFSAETYRAMSAEVWDAEGTVPGMCIEVAVRMGASKIELIGVDLSYAEGHTHAKGTMDDTAIDVEGLQKVKSVTGGEVYTSSLFAEYIKDIENQIKRHPKVTFYNLSPNGAFIMGTRKKEM